MQLQIYSNVDKLVVLDRNMSFHEKNRVMLHPSYQLLFFVEKEHLDK